MIKPLVRLAGLLILIALVGTALWSFYPAFFPDLNRWNRDFVIGVTAFAIGVVTFFGITALNHPAKGQQVFKGERLRSAIACALVMSYLFMATFTTFVGNALQVGPVTKEFVESFSSIISVTIAFYFGASAATQIFGKEKDDQPDSKSVGQQHEHEDKSPS